MDKTTKNKMDKQKCNNSPIKKQSRNSIKKPKNQSSIMTILDNAHINADINIIDKLIKDFIIKDKIM